MDFSSHLESTLSSERPRSSQRIHAHLVRAVMDNLALIFGRGGYADKVIENSLKSHPKWGARDRRFVAELTYDIVRHWRKFCWALELDETNHEWEEEALADVVEIALIDLGWIDDTEGLQKALIRLRAADVPRAVRHSLPDWLDQLGVETWGSDWEKLIASLNTQAPVCLRTNRLKTDRKTLATRLKQENEIETTFDKNSPDGLILKERANVFRTESFKEGWFEMQDISSQCVTELLNPQPGEKIIDACAGAGGKSLHIASLMQNKGKLWSLDVEQRKLDELMKRARRGGVSCLESRVIDSTKTIKRLDGVADALLLDVPCSGLGVIRRNPDTKWKLTRAEIDRLIQLQAEILHNYPRMVKPGGRMVYATCSLLPEENERQVEKFLPAQPQWKLVEQKTLRPDQDGFDGFFMAYLRHTPVS
jgi:16S rRNA (cytosine967-C5)-methyltransferase